MGQFTNYWQTINDILAEYAKDITHYYLWNSTCGLITKKELEASIISQRGTGGTSPSDVAKVIVNQGHRNIILVTDGEVCDRDVTMCDTIFKNAFEAKQFTINKAVCYVIGRYNEPNLSVTCPFTRRCESKVFSKSGADPLKTVMQYTQEDYKVLDSLDSISL